MKQRPRRFARKGAERRYVPGFRRKPEGRVAGKRGVPAAGYSWLPETWDKHPKAA